MFFFLNVMVTSGKIRPTFRRKKGKFDKQVFIVTKIIVLCGKGSRELLVKCDLKLFYFARSNMDFCFFFCTFLPIMTCNCLSKLTTLHQIHKLESRRVDFFMLCSLLFIVSFAILDLKRGVLNDSVTVISFTF